MNQSLYLCYDLKGIQSFIFAVPRLRYICGGSAIVDQFDRKTVQKLKANGCELLFAGGGKGAFACESAAAAEALQKQLVKSAHAEGLGISFGCHADYNEASHMTTATFPYLPASLEGQPCTASGLYPVPVPGVHPVVKLRSEQRWYFEEELLSSVVLPDGKEIARCAFFSNVSADDTDEWCEGAEGSRVLGNRNRWAVICMDGNDMGRQHGAAVEQFGGDAEAYQDWLKAMSVSLDDTTRGACRHGIDQVIQAWWKDVKTGRAKTGETRERELILPVRPLLVGGDDVVMLCHVQYAATFVKAVCRAFEESSTRLGTDYKAQHGVDLWPASQGKGLTISAGILFAPVKLPLSMAIGLAESLLASAKQRGRRGNDVVPAPACIDWESVTEGLIDTIARRRQQELHFKDGDLGGVRVSLTTRPCTLPEFGEIEGLACKYEKTPGTIRHQVIGALRAACGDRRAYVERLRKHQRDLAADLDHGEMATTAGKWIYDAGRKELRTPVVDAMLLLEESSRMAMQTAGGEA